ncbi:MAG: TerC family protein [Bacteroidetes bacterium]|nr:TerC family protein [Fibrella sp.]
MDQLLTAESLISLITLTFLEIVLGIDNIIFISIAANRLSPTDQPRARNIGLILAMAFRLLLLLGISFVIALSKPFTSVDADWFRAEPTGQSMILFVGGLFLLYKATSEIHHKLEGGADEGDADEKKAKSTISSVVTQIAITNIIFSIDSILTAIGLTRNVPIMMIAVIISVLVMMFFAGPVGRFVNQHPTVQMLGLAFLIMIGFMLIAEGAHLSKVAFFEQEVGIVPKGYLYFAIAFSLLVEFLNIRLRKTQKPIQLNTYQGQPGRDGMA